VRFQAGGLAERLLMACLWAQSGFNSGVSLSLYLFLCLSLQYTPPPFNFLIALLCFFLSLFCFVSQWAREGCVGVFLS
jgi:hypothetical protein